MSSVTSLHDEAFEGEDKIVGPLPSKPDLLIIDDMGMKQLPKRSGEFLFEIIMRRYELKSTMMTSNRPLEDWGKLIGDVPGRHGHPGSLPAPRRDDHHHRQELPTPQPKRQRNGRRSDTEHAAQETQQSAQEGNWQVNSKPAKSAHRVSD